MKREFLLRTLTYPEPNSCQPSPDFRATIDFGGGTNVRPTSRSDRHTTWHHRFKSACMIRRNISGTDQPSRTFNRAPLVDKSFVEHQTGASMPVAI
jgi:hypothetical protein